MNSNDELGVRVRYSTIVNYIGQLYWLVMSILFTIIVTRKLSVEEYGLFTTIMAVFNIIVLMYNLWIFWVPRAYARGLYENVSSAFALSLLYTPIGVAIMIIIGLEYNALLGFGLSAFTLASLLIVSEALNRYLRGVALGSKPFINGKVLIVRGTMRVAMAYVFVVILLYKLVGAVAAIIIAGFIASASYYILLRYYGVHVPKPMVSRREFKRIFKNSYIPLLVVLSGLMGYLERPLLTVITVSTVAAAYLGVSYIPRNIVFKSAQALASGLSAKLLRKPNRVDIEDVLRITFILVFGMNIFLLTLSVPVLSLFREEYVNAQPLFVLFVVESIIVALANIMASIAMAVERKDVYFEGLALASTPLFRIPFIRLIRNTLSLVTAVIVMYLLIISGVKDVITITLPYPIAWLASSIPFLYYTYREARRKIEFSIPWRELFSTLIAGVVASLYLFMTGVTSFVIKSFWADSPLLIKDVLIGIAIYAVVLYLLSPWTRAFVKKSLKYYLQGRAST
ncbi:hypothetical protein J4526_06930 [Desulfurococcaceae archaeon MEX13E-LK6-19]|nr:hypothetical protein J4526_06930 [Desulfurococcaceae archaeon MEX13E-LK6-19]